MLEGPAVFSGDFNAGVTGDQVLFEVNSMVAYFTPLP